MQRDKNVFNEAIRSLPYIPRTGWLWALAACGSSALIDVAFWAAGAKISWAWAVPFLALTAGWFAAIYVSAIGILSRQPTYQGYLRFALTSLVLLLPFALALGALFAIGSILTKGGGLAIFFIGAVAAFVLASLLVSWPMAQSLSKGFVSPIRILKATRGQRASLVFLGFTAAAIGRSDLLPKISEAQTVTEAIAIAIGFAIDTDRVPNNLPWQVRVDETAKAALGEFRDLQEKFDLEAIARESFPALVAEVSDAKEVIYFGWWVESRS